MGADQSGASLRRKNTRQTQGHGSQARKVLREIVGETERDLVKSIGIYRNGHQSHVYLDTAFKWKDWWELVYHSKDYLITIILTREQEDTWNRKLNYQVESLLWTHEEIPEEQVTWPRAPSQVTGSRREPTSPPPLYLPHILGCLSLLRGRAGLWKLGIMAYAYFSDTQAWKQNPQIGWAK